MQKGTTVPRSSTEPPAHKERVVGTTVQRGPAGLRARNEPVGTVWCAPSAQTVGATAPRASCTQRQQEAPGVQRRAPEVAHVVREHHSAYFAESAVEVIAAASSPTHSCGLRHSKSMSPVRRASRETDPRASGPRSVGRCFGIGATRDDTRRADRRKISSEGLGEPHEAKAIPSTKVPFVRQAGSDRMLTQHDVPAAI